MKNPDYSFTIAQPAVTVEDIDDPATVNAGIELLDQEAVKLQSQPLRARRVIVRLGPGPGNRRVDTGGGLTYRACRSPVVAEAPGGGCQC